MRILHVAAHLGGGVGKAHAALAEARRAAGTAEDHRFLLLETPRDARFAERIAAAGCTLVVAPPAAEVAALVGAADVLQVEWWGHPRLYGVFAETPLPAHRLLLWSHVSGLAPPLLPPGLAAIADLTAFTSACSFEAENLAAAIARRPQAFAAVNSGFGLAASSLPRSRKPRQGSGGMPVFVMLGTLDFAKLHRGFFDVVDAVARDLRVRLFGHVDPGGDVAAAAAAMRHPERVVFEGHVADPAAALHGADGFLYLLSRDHYGTGENALVEAMSLGLCPLVFANPAERAIVEDRATGLVANTVEEAVRRLAWMVDNPADVARLGAEAARRIAESHSPEASLAAFSALYRQVMAAPPRRRAYGRALGAGPADWFAASVGGIAETGSAAGSLPQVVSRLPSKGSLRHFRECFPGDAALQALAG
ncbi:glycosyltransferase [Jiella sonneratiae]|uniref:Glycosyltransferase n=1 Tax=Jiella sonneratiae TaxID=2816856 RepID=A0ABS3IZZ7_9HYPH|nr:glycosyltransferase [Jiella sonneratiae]MBO0902982.1 glycosyltransferase [Jiella sonneratiae]